MRSGNLYFAFLTLFYLISCSGQKNQELPNIIIILADDLGWNDIGYQNKAIQTPNLDQLAAQNVVFDRLYTAPVCTPTRAGLLTGRYPHRFGMGYKVVSPRTLEGLPTKEVTLAEKLAEHGFKNRAIFGKWHLGHSHLKYHPLNQGFTYFYGHYNGAIDYFSHKRDGELDWHENFESSYDQGYSTNLIGLKVTEYISKVKDEGPFFTYVAFNAPHSPMQAKKDDLLKYGYNPNRPQEDFPVGGQRQGERESDIYGKKGRGNTLRQTFSAMVTSMDMAIGKIIRKLKMEELYENTIIWFLSDNGGTYTFGGSNKPLRGQKHQLWEGGIRVPSVLKLASKGKPLEVEEATAYIDIFPTLMHLIGIREYGEVDGVSIQPLLEGKKIRKRTIYLGSDAVIDQDWKLVYGQLFNIKEDPLEKSDISQHFPQKKKTLESIALNYKEIEKGSYSFQSAKWTPPKEWRISKGKIKNNVD